jgi:hypothetical protein
MSSRWLLEKDFALWSCYNTVRNTLTQSYKIMSPELLSKVKVLLIYGQYGISQIKVNVTARTSAPPEERMCDNGLSDRISSQFAGAIKLFSRIKFKYGFQYLEIRALSFLILTAEGRVSS